MNSSSISRPDARDAKLSGEAEPLSATARLTRAQIAWFGYAEEHEGVCYNPYSAPGAWRRWRKMLAKSVAQGFVTNREDVWSLVRGGGFDLTDAGRVALLKALPAQPQDQQSAGDKSREAP